MKTGSWPASDVVSRWCRRQWRRRTPAPCTHGQSKRTSAQRSVLTRAGNKVRSKTPPASAQRRQRAARIHLGLRRAAAPNQSRQHVHKPRGLDGRRWLCCRDLLAVVALSDARNGSCHICIPRHDWGIPVPERIEGARCRARLTAGEGRVSGTALAHQEPLQWEGPHAASMSSWHSCSSRRQKQKLTAGSSKGALAATARRRDACRWAYACSSARARSTPLWAYCTRIRRSGRAKNSPHSLA